MPFLFWNNADNRCFCLMLQLKLIAVTLHQTNKKLLVFEIQKSENHHFRGSCSNMRVPGCWTSFVCHCWRFLKCVLQCLIGDELQLKTFPHSLQSQGFSPAWILWCLAKDASCLQAFPQWLHSYSSAYSLMNEKMYSLAKGFPTFLTFMVFPQYEFSGVESGMCYGWRFYCTH